MAESPPDEKFEAKVKNICGLYQEAANLRAKKERVVSTDEMTGIQALERKSPDKPMKPGQPIKREFEYLRHGTQHSRVPLRLSATRGRSSNLNC